MQNEFVAQLLEAAKIDRNAAFTLAVSLSGDANKTKRQEVMLALTGQQLPIAKCGINAIADKAVEMVAEAKEEQAIEEVENYTVVDADGVVYDRRKDLEAHLRESVKTYEDAAKFVADLPEGVALFHRKRRLVSREFSYNLVWEDADGVKHTPKMQQVAEGYKVQDEYGELPHLTETLRALQTPGQFIEFYNSLAEGQSITNAKGKAVQGVVYVGFNTVHSEGEKTFELGGRTYNIATYYRVVQLVKG